MLLVKLMGYYYYVILLLSVFLCGIGDLENIVGGHMVLNCLFYVLLVTVDCPSVEAETPALLPVYYLWATPPPCQSLLQTFDPFPGF